MLANERNIDRDWKWNLVEVRFADKFSTEGYWIEFHISWNFAAGVFNGLFYSWKLLGFSFNRNHHSRLYFKRSAVDFFAVDLHVAMSHELLGCKNRWSEPKAVHNVI